MEPGGTTVALKTYACALLGGAQALPSDAMIKIALARR